MLNLKVRYNQLIRTSATTFSFTFSSSQTRKSHDCFTATLVGIIVSNVFDLYDKWRYGIEA